MAADPSPRDTELATRSQAGDRHAFELLVQRHKASLYRFVRRYVRTDDDAYDILQDSFVSAWLALKRYDPAKSFSTWLRAIALNKCRDFGRRQAVRQRLSGMVAFLETTRREEDNEADIEHRERQDERLQRLDTAIAELPSFYKEPLLLTTAGGLSQQQTAEQLGTTTKAIEMRIRRAKKRLAASLGDLKTDE